MIYDTEIQILRLPDTVGTPMQGKLQLRFTAFCGELEVFHRRYWEAVAAYSRIDRMVELPLHRKIDVGMFVKFKDHIYSVEQVQFGKDAYQLPITTLSLKRSEVQYDIAAV